MSRILTLMLYGHLIYHSPKVIGCLLWIRTNGTWQKGHSLLTLPVAHEPAEVTFIRLPVQFPPWCGCIGAAAAAWRGHGGAAVVAWRGSVGAATVAWLGRGGGLAQTVGARTPGDARPVDGGLAWTGGGGRRRAPARTPVETERENGRERRNCRDREEQSKRIR